MSEERPLLFVRRASGLTRAISRWPALFWSLGGQFLPWHYFLYTAIPQWFPGVNLPLLYFMGGVILFVEISGMALCYAAVPRSGSIYVPLSRSVSPMLGVMEATRSYLTNPFQRGVTAFFAAGAMASLFIITGQLSKDPSLQQMGAAFQANPWNLVGLAILFNFIGWVVNILGPRVMSKWVLFWGAGSLLSIIVVNGTMGAVPVGGLKARWDNVFGAGAYDEIVRLAQQGGYATAPVSLEATLPALLIPVSNNWPYTVMPVCGEVENPRRNIPFSMLGAALIVLVVNTLTAYNYTSRYGDFGNMYAFVVSKPDLVKQFRFNQVMPVIDLSAYSAVLAAPATALVAFIGFAPQWGNFADVILNDNYTSRPLYAMSMDRMFPEVFSRVHPRFHSPWVGNTFWFIATIPTSLLAGAYVGTVAAVVFGITFTYAFARMFQHWSEIELPYKMPEAYRSGIALYVRGIPLISILGAISTAIFLYLLATGSPNPVSSAVFIGIIYGFGALTYFYFAARNAKKGLPPSKIYAELPPE